MRLHTVTALAVSPVVVRIDARAGECTEQHRYRSLGWCRPGAASSQRAIIRAGWWPFWFSGAAKWRARTLLLRKGSPV